MRPADETKLPAVLVIHENRGLNPYIEDVAPRRLAVADFITTVWLKPPRSELRPLSSC